MDLGEAVHLLGKWSREELRVAVTDGIALPSSGRIVVLQARRVGRDFDISEEHLDAFIGEFENEEPGRWPRVAIRRELLVESGHRCAICEDSAPLQYHHIVQFNRVPHYDTRHMLAICGTCHHKCTVGMIDRTAQRMYKARLSTPGSSIVSQTNGGPMYLSAEGPARFSWEDLRDVLLALHQSLGAEEQEGISQYDFSDVVLIEKNHLNQMGEDYFYEMRTHHEPYFGRIKSFVEDPTNTGLREKYFEIVDELRAKMATDRAAFGNFEQILQRFADIAVQNSANGLKGKRRALNILLSFMYFNCDIGRKA